MALVLLLAAGVQAQPPPGIASYNAAVASAREGRIDEAFKHLEDAVARNIATPWLIEQEAGFANLRADARYRPLLERAERCAFPCKFDERHRSLDFWVGDWDVVQAANGMRIGGNRITIASGGCAIHERWTSRNGSVGESLNFFDAAAGVWRQIWVAQGGSIIRYEGTVKDGAMHYAGDAIGPGGARSLQRVVLAPQPDGRVRHTVQSSSDDGRTWTVAFDAWYVKKTQ